MRLEGALGSVALLIAAIAIVYAQVEPVQGQVVAVEITSSTAAPITPAITTIAASPITPPVTTAQVSLTTAPQTTSPAPTIPPTTIPETTTTEAPTLGPNESVIATASEEIPFLLAYDGPEGNIIPLPFVVPNPHQFGGPLTLRVVEGSIADDWVKVALPVRPNGQEAWIPTDGYTMDTTTIHAVVNLSETSVRVFDDDVLIAESQAAIGNPNTPTPLGTFYVAAVRENPASESFLGTHALVLSGFSEALETFSGGLPVIAIHGTNTPEGQLGHAISNGCIRVPNDVIQFLARHVPAGAPVTIFG